MFCEMIQEQISSNFSKSLYQMNLSILDEKYVICTNYSKSIDYLKGLFYPNGVNGVSVLEKLEENETCITIRCLQNVSKSEFSKFVNIIEERWNPCERVSPVINGYYQVFENENQKCYVQDYENDTSEEHLIWINGNEYTLVTIEANHEYMVLSRFIREIGYRKLENEGYISLHSSAVEMDSKGYLIIGDSGAGKSTLALTLGKFFKATYIANDRVMVKFTKDGVKAIPFGMPIKVNYGTLKTLQVEAEFRKWKNTIPLASTKTFYDYNGENKLNLLPVELEKFMEMKVGSSINVTGIILPYIKDKEKKEGDSVYEIVKRNCYYKKEPVYIQDWLGINLLNKEVMSYEDIMDKLLKLDIYRTEINIFEFRKSVEHIVSSITVFCRGKM